MNTATMKKVSDTVIKLKYNDEVIFWREEYTSSKGKVVTITAPELRSYIRREKFRVIDGEPVQLKGNIAIKVTADDIYKHCLKYVETFEDPTIESAFIRQGETLLLKNKGIVISLQECEIPHLRDTKTTGYHFYKNGILKVEEACDFVLIPFEDAKGFIWEDEIKDRDFHILNDEDIEKAMFSKFLQNITNDEEHFLSLCSAIGYLIHVYKDERKPICVIINDENLVDDGKPEGGTGKGLIVKAISQIVEKAMYNGKNSDFTNNKFAFQNVRETTAVIVIDDAPRNFDLEALFSVLTDDMPIERKHKEVKVIPYEKSPKFVITTNYSIKGTSSSYKRRRFDTFLTNYYSDMRTPSDEFGCEFFHGWDAEEWRLFDFFMMGCLRKYLTDGLITFENEALRLKMLKNETSSDFFELMEERFNLKNILYSYNAVRQTLFTEYGEKYYFLEKNKRKIVEWVEMYAGEKGYSIKKSRDGAGTNFTFQ